MKTFKKLSAILACACVLGAGSAWAEDRVVENVSPMDEVQVNPEIMRAPVMFTTYGKLVAVEDGRYVVEGEGNLRVVAAEVDRDTYIIDENAKLRLPYALKVGQTVTVFYSAQTTRSLPAQSHALAIVIGEREAAPSFIEVAEAKLSADGKSMTVLNNNNDLITTIGSDACKNFAKIKKGDKLLLWSRMVTMSLPGLTNAEKVIILP
ncbi:hypothetical protein [uncultured Phascolarctobacterium sp.]|uniref:hypothetical protein n=1 Tax=uncultured Phascolarctobacterium sp. TaxID=512296 RepID=UPI0025D10591|nr:hypothetical protein [uncultured Phascolarctobacterium sp.]